MFSNPSESIPCFFIFWLVFENNSDCSASRGTRRATAVYVIQFTREPARPASREACCRAAVKPRPTLTSPYAPARIARSPGCRGTAPALGEDAAEVFAGLLGGIDEEVAHVQLDGLARFHAHALVGVGDDTQLLAAAQIDAAVVHIA